MNVLKISSLLIVATLSSAAMAQTTDKTRAEVKAETKDAIRSGDVTAPGDSGKTVREQSPESFGARKPSKKAKTAKVRAAVDQPASTPTTPVDIR